MRTLIGLIAHERFARGLRRAGFDVITAGTPQSASRLVKDHSDDTPSVSISTDDFVVPAQVPAFLGRVGAGHIAYTESDLPLTMADLAWKLGIELPDGAHGASLAADGELLTPGVSADAPDADAHEQPAAATTGWEDDDEWATADDTVDDEPPTLAPALEYDTLRPIAPTPIEVPLDDPAPVSAETAVPAQPRDAGASSGREDETSGLPRDLSTEALLELLAARGIDPTTTSIPAPDSPAPAADPTRPRVDPWKAAGIEVAGRRSFIDEVVNDAPPPAPEPSADVPVAGTVDSQADSHSPQLAPPTAAPDDDADALLRRADARAAHAPAPPTLRPGGAEILISWAAAGGVAKSSTAITLAEIAANAGLRALLVDANRGQPDVTKFVLRRMRDDDVRTIHAAVTRSPDQARMPASEVNEYRRIAGNAHPVAFDVVLGPSAGVHDRGVHSAELYRTVIEQLRPEYDLIVIDTQILDNDSSDLWQRLLTPLIRAGAWSLGMADGTTAKQNNLRDQLRRFQQQQVPTGKMLTIATMQTAFDDGSQSDFERFFRPSAFLGATLEDPRFRQEMSSGIRIVADSPLVTPVLQRVLARLFDLPAFHPDGTRQRRTWRSLFGRGNR